MAKSKSINVFLIDGDPTGRVKCTMQNWTGVAYKIPRIKLEECKKSGGDLRKHLAQTGIYFLVGANDDGQEVVYVGQAAIRKNGEGLLGRLLEHKKSDKEPYSNDWNEAICFTTTDDKLGQTEISYLENRFTILAKEAKRYSVLNGNEPTRGNITEEKESEMEEFAEYARIIMGVLGHKVFEPFVKPVAEAESQEEDSPIFSYKGKFDARGKMTNEGFVVLAGSEINPHTSPSFRDTYKKERERNKGKISAESTLIEDILFTSPSAAATFVGGTPLSGNALWRTDGNKSPKDF